MAQQRGQVIDPNEWEDYNLEQWEDVNPPTLPEAEPGFLSKVWSAISEPLITAPSEWARRKATEMTDPNNKPGWLTGFGAGALEGFGDLVSGLSSPVNIGATALTGGSSLAARAGLPQVARIANIGARVASAPVAAHGATTILDPETSLGEKAFGLAELAGGAAGVAQKTPVRPVSRPQAAPRVAPAVAEGIAPDVAGSARIKPATAAGAASEADDLIKQLGLKDPDNWEVIDDPFSGRVNNASGTPGGGSAEEILRQASMKAKGDQFVVYDRMGNERPIIGVDAQDYRVQPGETFGIKHADGTFTKYDDAGGKVPTPGAVPTTPTTTPNRPSAIYLKNPSPMAIKKAMQEGYVLDSNNPIREDGAIRYIKTDKKPDLPILEAEVPLAQRRAGAGGPPQPPKPPKKAIDEGPVTPEPKPPKPEEKVSKLREAYELSRALMSIDLPFTTSAAFRQALPMVGTKNWWKAWGTSFKAYGSEASYQATMKRIQDSPLFRERPGVGGKTTPSFADEVGLRMTDLGKLSKREEMLRSTLAEKIPVYGKLVRASNRAYTAFLNDLRANMFESLLKDADIVGQGGANNLPLAKAVAEFINDATGRGSLKTHVGIGKNFTKEVSLEQSAKFLTDTLFSPRLIASRVRMLNPQTYIMAPPGVRKQYLHGMMRTIGAWWGIASLAELAGAEVSKDPNSADFGKIKIGNTRLDPAGGFQQYLVLGSRMRPEWAKIGEGDLESGIGMIDLPSGLLGHGGGGITSSVSNRFSPFGQGYKPETRMSTLQEFATNKMHPTLKFAYDLLRAQENRPVNLGDRTVQMFLPIIAGDIAELLREDPSLLPLVIPLGTFGVGSQTYSGGIEEPSFIPDEWDIKIGGRR